MVSNEELEAIGITNNENKSNNFKKENIKTNGIYNNIKTNTNSNGLIIGIIVFIVIVIVSISSSSGSSGNRYKNLTKEQKSYLQQTYGNGKSQAIDKAIKDYKSSH